MIGVGWNSQGGRHNEPVVKDVGFEELAGESVVNFGIKRIRVLEKKNCSILERIGVLEPKRPRFKFGLLHLPTV